MKKKFSFAALLSIIVSRHLTEELAKHYDLIGFLTGTYTVGPSPDGLMLYRRAQTVLFEQFPQFETGEMQFAQGELVLMLETEEGQRYPKELMLGWLSKQAIRMNMDMNAVFEVEKP